MGNRPEAFGPRRVAARCHRAYLGGMQRLWQLGGTIAVLLVGGGVALGCGSNVQWEPAQIPPETLVPPPNVPGEGDGGELADAFDDIEGVDEAAPAPEAPAPEAPAPEAAAPPAPAPDAKAPAAPKAGAKPAPAPAKK